MDGGGKNPNGTTYRSYYVRNGLRRAAIQSTKHGSGSKMARRGTVDRRDHHGQARNRNGRAKSVSMHALAFADNVEAVPRCYCMGFRTYDPVDTSLRD
jgi:hypothetical protein